MSKISVEVGILLRGKMRRLLEEAVFYDQLESYKEVKGFLTSDFLLEDPKPAVIEWIKSFTDA